MADPLSIAIPMSSSFKGAVALVTPQATVGYTPVIPGAPGNPPIFVFDYEGENTAEVESDITDHFVEDNTAIQDQISLPPVLVTVQGFIGELASLVPVPQIQAVQNLATLPFVQSFFPEFSVAAQQATALAAEGYRLDRKVEGTQVSSWASIATGNGIGTIGSNGLQRGGPNQTKQQLAFQTFYSYRQSRTLFTIQTPWAIFQNMAIKTMKATQTAETRLITDFRMVFKQLRFANTTTTPEAVATGYAGQRAVSVVDLGIGTGSPGPSVSQAVAGVSP